ncbi:GNAT family N-acetyltransferase [Roseisalinus antarcticus]|uniref:Ribosomal-protein-L7/L12-serine acetyltransferase n=1 Tax=Roseisalinus antarcticus TaxID=254357 RepID=A0A1Y5RXX5_9RHOB|nr:GNAT family protein [Roseisalinus antarcticus]SLN26948.1 ribosomal-protein-L7/L12-serine acetyltransferase [Roseisalinus antarcticus]
MTIAGWTPPPWPARVPLAGRHARLEPLTAAHVPGLDAAHREDAQGAMWRYLPVGPFEAEAGYAAWVEAARILPDPLHYAVRMRDGRLGGTLSLMRITPQAGTIEVGWVTFAPRLQRTVEATEAIYLLMKWAFEAGYRRFEWKCDAANLGSRRAAQRFGLSYEGIFRQAAVVKGRNRDTAWLAAIDGEWPALEAAFEAWLNPDNFGADGRQRTSLATLTGSILVQRDPALSYRHPPGERSA